ncbi:7tm Odorant receptor [Popillia japonica]|uniref:7tm Odorant receptor n=1 Tax=Popillia japonica TaxID=7064 RepID=A0AAW1LTW6_POPJA
MTANGFPPSTSNLIRGGPYALSALAQILIYSAVGEKIVEQTEDIAQVTYEVDWYTNYRPKFRKMLSLIMQRSQKASQITAGGVWYLNMNTFGQILRGSMSLLAFMQTIYANKRN